MANICNNEFYAYSENPENIKTIENFFEENWGYCDIYNVTTEEIEVRFDSKWDFPEEKMDELYSLIPDKENIYMRCLSVEYGCDYVAYWKCNSDGWEQIV